MVPSTIYRVAAVCCVVPEVYLPRVVHHSHQLVDRILDRVVARRRDDLREVESCRYPDAVTKFGLVEFAE